MPGQNNNTSCLGVELRKIADEQYSCRYCVAALQKQKLSLSQMKQAEGNLASILQKLPKNLPVALSLSGKGVLMKPAENQNEDADLVQTAFPAINRTDFYSQVAPGLTHTYLSVSRKEDADKIVGIFTQAGFTICRLAFGPFAAINILNQLNIFQETTRFDGHQFTVNKGQKLVKYAADPQAVNSFPVKIDIQTIPEQNIVAYANAFQLLLHDKLQGIYADADLVNENFKRRQENQSLRKTGLSLLLVFFALLLISFLVFSYYNGENAMLMRQAGAKSIKTENTEQLQSRIAEQEAKLHQLGWNGGYSHAYLADQIGQSTPRQITLESLEMKRTDGAIGKKEPAVNQIKIVGYTRDLLAMNNWIFVLKEKSWVKQVKLIRYLASSTEGQYSFTIHIDY